MFCRKNAGYGVGSRGDGSAPEGDCGLDGIIRLGALAEGVRKGVLAEGVCIEEVAAECVLSLLRERLEEDGEVETASGADDMVFVSVVVPLLTLALRLKARNLCSLPVALLDSWGTLAVSAEKEREGLRRKRGRSGVGCEFGRVVL